MSSAGIRSDVKNCSTAQKSILHCIKMLSPFQKVLIKEKVSFSEDDIVLGEEQFYEFIKKIYMAMYENPHKYHVPTVPYDEYMKTAKLKKGIEKQHYTDSKECSLRNTFQQAIQFYAKYFYEIGIRMLEIRENDYALVIPKQQLEEAYNSLEGTHLRNENEFRHVAIMELGIEIEDIQDMCYIISRNYPKMFIGLWVLCSAPENRYKYTNYLRLDYMGYYRAMPGIEDIKATLTQEHGDIIDEIQNSLVDMKLKVKVKPLRNITSGFRWKVEYCYKGKNVFGFYAEPGYLMLCIYFNNASNISQMSSELQKTNYDLFSWFSSKFPERLCKCPNNRWAVFGEYRRRICGLSNRAEIENPNAADLKNSLMVLKMFRQ